MKNIIKLKDGLVIRKEKIKMSKEYCINTNTVSAPTTDEVMRIHCQRPGKRDEEGNLIYFTEQAHKNRCDIRQIIKKYSKTHIIDHVSKFEARYGDMSGVDFKRAHDTVVNARVLFNDLPSDIRKRFRNDPGELLEFMEDPGNRDEAIELGLINKQWTPETDGIGEHVKEGGNVIEKPPEGVKE